MSSPQTLRTLWMVTLVAACTAALAADLPPPAPTSAPAAPPAVPAPATTAPEDPLVAAAVLSSNSLGADLYAQLREGRGNVALSPLGLMQALLPLSAGVQGPAGDELRRALHLVQTPAEAADGCAALSRRLQRAAGNETNLTLARALWVQQWNTIRNDYIDLIRQHGRSELRVIDFARPEYAVHWMNRWIGDRTDDRIPAIADAHSYDPHSCIVVASGVCFRTPWACDFEVTATVSLPFSIPVEPPKPVPAQPAAAPASAAGQPPVAASAPAADPTATTPATRVAGAPSRPPGAAATPLAPQPSTPPPAAPPPVAVEVPTMHRIAPLRLLARPGFRLVELPYRSEQLSLVVLVPDAEVPLAKIEAQLSAAKLGEWLQGVHAAPVTRVELRLPRFRVAQPIVRLDGALRALGVKLVFDREGAADFTPFGVNPDGSPVYLSAVSHLAKFDVAEQGSAASPPAIVPADVAADVAAPVEVPTLLVVDRPFLFFVCDQVSGVVLLMGRIVDPRAS